MLVKEKNLEIAAENGAVIPAILTGGTKQKAVLIAHGLCGDKNEWYDTSARIAEKLEENGITCLRIDFRGHGDSAEPLSDFTPSSQLSDMESAYRWLRQNGFCGIIPLGISFGGPAAVRLAALHPDAIPSCVLIAPVTDYARNILTPDTDWGKETFVPVPDGDGGECYRITDSYVMGSALIREMKSLDLPAVFAGMKKQTVYIFHGEKDPKIAFAGSEELSRKYPETVRLTPLADTVHGLTAAGDGTFTAPQTLLNLGSVIDICKNSHILRPLL